MKFEKGTRVYIKGLRVIGVHPNGEIICAWDAKNGMTQIVIPEESLVASGGPPARPFV